MEITELITNKLTFLFALALSIFGVIKAIEVFAKERSIGTTALLKVKQDISELKKLIDEGESNTEELKRRVSQLEEDYRMLIEKALNYWQQKRGR